MNDSADTLTQDPLSHGLWARSVSPLPVAGPLSGDIEADVAVVGAGFTGLAAALRVAERGASVIVLEARDVGYGASGRNVGLVNAGLWLRPRQIVDRLGSDHGERLVSLLADAPARVFELIDEHAMPCQASRAGTLHCAHAPAGFEDLRQRAEEWQARGAPVELLDKGTAAGKIGSDWFHGALADHRAGTVQPLDYARGLARAAAAAGARIHPRSAVRSLRRHGDRWRAETDSGAAFADRVVIATNAYTEAVAPVADCVVPYTFFQLATEPLAPAIRESILPEGHGAWDTGKILTSLRLDDTGRLVVGSFGRLDRRLRGVHANWMRRKTRRMFPQIGRVSFEHGWQGIIAKTGDDLPRMSQPQPGVVTAYGYNGRGIGTGTVFGPALADYALDGDESALPLPLTPMTPEPRRALRALGVDLAVTTYHFIANRW